jgi:uncharacterized YigZ family protein
MVDHYLSIKEIFSAEFKEKGSKFLAFAHPICNEEDVKTIIDNYKKEYFDARHVCYAYSFGIDNEILKSSDAGEPNGTAGLPILNQIRSSNLKNIFIVVVRYFGGTKLGVSGLINAYKTAAKEAIANAVKIELPITSILEFSFPYLKMNIVMKLVKETGAIILEQDFGGNECIIKISILKSKLDYFERQVVF